MADWPPASAIPGSIYQASFYNTETRDRFSDVYAGEISLTGQTAGDLMTALNDTQWVRITREELIAELGGGGVQVVMQLDEEVAYEIEGDYDIALPVSLSDYTKAVFINQFAGGSGFGALHASFRFVDNDTLRVHLHSNAGSPSTGYVVGAVLE